MSLRLENVYFSFELQTCSTATYFYLDVYAYQKPKMFKSSLIIYLVSSKPVPSVILLILVNNNSIP